MPKHHVFIIGSVWVEPNSSAAGSRMLQLIELFLKQNWSVSFGCTASKNFNSIDLSSIGVAEINIQLNNSSFDDFLRQLDPSIVMFDRFMTEEKFGWRVAENLPNALRILDTEDLHCLRKTRQDSFKKNINFREDQLLTSEIAKREIASIFRCDFSLIISREEMRILNETFHIPADLLFYLPFLIDEKELEKKATPFEERTDFVSIGNFLHAPNLDATLFLKRLIWPEIKKKIPEARLHVYGAYPSQQVLNLNNEKEGFLVHGEAKNALEVISLSKVLLAPLRFGAGLKGKLLDAMLARTPSVTTSIGAEGMMKNNLWNGFVADVNTEFIEKSVVLYSDKNLWLSAQKNGLEIVKNEFLQSQFEEDFLYKILNTTNRLADHRKYNFIGAMLQHHTTKSTKYLSKWIEEKNKD